MKNEVQEAPVANDVMIDLETVGSGSNAAIISIGAAIWNPFTGKFGSTFYQAINLTDALNYGEVDGQTIEWWMRQGDQARAVFNDANRVTLKDALLAFQDWIYQTGNFHKRVVWGNGATFDNVILSNAYEATNMTKPWPFYGDRDVRTVVDIGRRIFGIDPKRNIPMKGVSHNALDDAKHQCLYVTDIYQKLQSKDALKAA